MPAPLDPLTAHHHPTTVSRGDGRRARVVVFAAAGAETDISRATAWARARGYEVDLLDDEAAFASLLLRSRPVLAVLVGDRQAVAAACRGAKADAYTALVPAIAVVERDIDAADRELVAELFAAGADDVVVDAADVEMWTRCDAAINRSQRDLSAQPTTRLPGTVAIERELAARLKAGDQFAACYADLDHFKEYNDRYGYHEGDRVIRLVARMLHDVVVGVAGSGPRGGFVGHVGGDDFLAIVPLELATQVCALAVETFDLLAPLQYGNADRQAGYYFGKDRRGRLHRVPLMTLSIGVATTDRRHFASAAEVSRLASEMKSFAKSQSGSVYAFDRRGVESASSVASYHTAARSAT